MNISESRVKSLLLLIGVLVISNLITAYFLFSHSRPQKKERTGILKNFIKNELKFSDAQMASYEASRKAFMTKHDSSIKSIRETKETNLKNVGLSGFSDSAIAVATNFSVEKQREFDKSFFENLKAIRNICTPEQRVKFDSGFYKNFLKMRERR